MGERKLGDLARAREGRPAESTPSRWSERRVCGVRSSEIRGVDAAIEERRSMVGCQSIDEIGLARVN